MEKTGPELELLNMVTKISLKKRSKTKQFENRTTNNTHRLPNNE
jgi:hypothetical protein